MTTTQLLKFLPARHRKKVSLLLTLGVLLVAGWNWWQETNKPTVLGEQSEVITVTEVVDGDTIKLSTGQTLRYIGIDTPETKHPQQGIECYGREAAQRNTELVLGKQVTLEKDVSETDRYGRLLRYVYVNGSMINQQLVQEGYAQASAYPPDIKHQSQLDQTEGAAKANQVGMWGIGVCPENETIIN
jgi:micrococcal nuclease